MNPMVVIIWSVLTMVSVGLMMYFLKNKKRKLGKYEMLFALLFIALSFMGGYTCYYALYENNHDLVWISRLTIFAIGVLSTWILFKRNWIIRDVINGDEDSFLIEFLYISVGSFISAFGFWGAARLFLLSKSLYFDISLELWDLPLYFMLPFLFVKLTDLAGQIPIKTIENPWVYPIEPVNPNDWPWRDLTQVNFELKSSLLEEYDFFEWNANPWIEGPKEVSIGKLFQLCIQERRRSSNLATIQDLGDEYGGAPKFCWLFSRKTIWFNPTTWFSKPKYLNPDLSLTMNKIGVNDVIIARRIPGDGTKLFGTDYNENEFDDPDKTVFIKR